jgi:hypothetical protein
MPDDFSVAEINLSPAAERLANIYFNKLSASDRANRLSRQAVWYAAASAAEAFQFTHEDIDRLLALGASRAQVQIVRQTGRQDAHFYLGLVSHWLKQQGDTSQAIGVPFVRNFRDQTLRVVAG